MAAAKLVHATLVYATLVPAILSVRVLAVAPDASARFHVLAVELASIR